MSPEEELRQARRELAQARRALQERRYARGQPISADLVVQALSAVLHHAIPEALAEARRDRTRLAEQLRETQAQLRAAKNSHTALRYELWHLAQAGILGAEWPLDALENVVRATEDSEDDADWERRNA
jgi:hypothetical protein